MVSQCTERDSSFMLSKMRQEMRDEHCIYLPQCRDVAFDVYMFKITPKLQQMLLKPYAPC